MTRPRWNVPQLPNPSRADPGLVAWLNETRVVLPLKGVECRFQVTGCLAEVWIDQIYHQDNREALNCQYQFPLPADASVFACEININGRLIRAKVEEREAARQLAEEKKAAGHRTGLVEMERDNLFTLQLGNVQPDDLVVVRLGYFQALHQLGAKRTVEIPFCPGIRYIPGEPLLRSLTISSRLHLTAFLIASSVLNSRLMCSSTMISSAPIASYWRAFLTVLTRAVVEILILSRGNRFLTRSTRKGMPTVTESAPA